MKFELNKIYLGDCIKAKIIQGFDENSIDSIVTDPPYDLTTTKRWGKNNKFSQSQSDIGKRFTKGFMGKKWDGTGIAFNIDTWAECLRVLKPGGHILSFGGTRTYHRMVCAIEDAGFEIRDTLQWIFAQGFPKSLNIGKQVDKIQGNKREVIGKSDGAKKLMEERPWNQNPNYDRDVDITKGNSEWEGFGTGLKPACEMIVLARKPLSEKNVALNVLKWGTGGINIDGCRIETNEIISNHSRSSISAKSKGKYGDSKEQKTHQTEGQKQGRFPSNVLLDEEAAELLDEMSGKTKSTGGKGEASQYPKYSGNTVGSYLKGKRANMGGLGDSGGSSRFFYVAKSSKAERSNGLEGKTFGSLEIILYICDVNKDMNIKTLQKCKDKDLTQEVKKVKLQVDMERSHLKVIGESGIQNNKEIDLNIVLFTKKILAIFQKVVKSIIKTTTGSIMIPETLKLLRHYITKEYTQDVKLELMDGGNNAENVKYINIYPNITKGKVGFLLGANHVVFKMQLKIKENESNIHPTCKPIKLMRYLVRLITPPNGVCLDPFTGSGTTPIACIIEGFDYIGIEKEKEYFDIAEKRIFHYKREGRLF